MIATVQTSSCEPKFPFPRIQCGCLRTFREPEGRFGKSFLQTSKPSNILSSKVKGQSGSFSFSVILTRLTDDG